jgi:AraC-like DNA-binding protein
MITTIPYLFTPYAYKLEIARHIAENPGYIALIQPTVLNRFFSNELVYQSRPLLALGYLLWSVGMVIRFVWKQQYSLVLQHQRYLLKWLSVLLFFSLFLILAHVFQIHNSFAQINDHLLTTFNILNLLSAIGIAGLLIPPFFFPTILYGLPRFARAQATLHPSNLPDDSTSSKESRTLLPVDETRSQSHPNQQDSNQREKQKPTPTFESDYMLKIRQKVEDCMREEKPYLQSGCNLPFLSKLINIPAHHLAYYFREEKRQSFTDYRNEWRIRHARDLIHEGKTRDLTLEAIGLLSGFSTRNTFYSAFKKVEGVSPSAYVSKR